MLQKIKIATTPYNFLWAQKLKVRNNSNFTVTFLTIWRCAGDLFELLLKLKMTAADQVRNFLWAQKSRNLLYGSGGM